MEIENLEWLEVISKSGENAICKVARGKTGKSFSSPVFIEIPLKIDRVTAAVYNYIYEALSWRMPKLIEYVFKNKTLMNLAGDFYRHKSKSLGSLYMYVQGVKRYCDYLGKTPDQLIAECYDTEGVPDSKTLYQHAVQLDNYLTELQLDGLTGGTISNYLKSVKALYAANKLILNYPYRVKKNIVNKDRAPTPEELQTLMDLGTPRERVIVTCLALGGFREGTLSKLRLYHVQEDLERGIVPIHVHVEAEITKGKYHDYDTFLGAEAVEAIKAYLKIRERGSPGGGVPPEELTPDSPLIRSEKSVEVKPIRPHQIYGVVHGLYHKAGLLKDKKGRMYNLRVHSIRKYFRTQLAALGVPADYIEYMMGHRVSTYHDIQMKGVEFLRNIYAASGFSIKPKTRLGRIEMLKEFTRLLGLNPEEILTRKALEEPHRAIITPEQREEIEIKELRAALREALRREILTEEESEGINSSTGLSLLEAANLLVENPKLGEPKSFHPSL
jgi:hypothetical protein